jgi:hypothetical protein
MMTHAPCDNPQGDGDGDFKPMDPLPPTHHLATQNPIQPRAPRPTLALQTLPYLEAVSHRSTSHNYHRHARLGKYLQD